MYFVYIIRSVNHPDQVYIGKTGNLKKRLSDHNSGSTFHTAKFKPWELVVYIAFANEAKAIAFEIYLKNGSGRAFASKRFI